MNTKYGFIADYKLVSFEKTHIVVSYDFEELKDGVNATWREVWFYKKKDGIPDIQRLKHAVLQDINELTDCKILLGFKWNNKPVYLSTENLFNFKAAYDLAVQTNGLNLPITFKLGEIDDEPIYHTFTTVEELADFYMKATAYINQCLNEGWLKKDNIDWSIYEEALNNNNE